MIDRNSGRKGGWAYILLLIAQTCTATFLFWMIFPLFQWMVWHLGETQDVPGGTQVSIVGGAIFLQCCYWTRYCCIEVQAPFHNPLLGHVLMFASRASFFFGGTLFSVIFFRHLPELDALPPLEQAAIKVIIVMGILFALFCYALELERIGKAFEEPATR